jgi:hypothetical protein
VPVSRVRRLWDAQGSSSASPAASAGSACGHAAMQARYDCFCVGRALAAALAMRRVRNRAARTSLSPVRRRDGLPVRRGEVRRTTAARSSCSCCWSSCCIASCCCMAAVCSLCRLSAACSSCRRCRRLSSASRAAAACCSTIACSACLASSTCTRLTKSNAFGHTARSEQLCSEQPRAVGPGEEQPAGPQRRRRESCLPSATGPGAVEFGT